MVSCTTGQVAQLAVGVVCDASVGGPVSQSHARAAEAAWPMGASVCWARTAAEQERKADAAAAGGGRRRQRSAEPCLCRVAVSRRR